MTQSISVTELLAQRVAGAKLVLLDVRRAPVFAQAADAIEGAVWRDPAWVDRWAPVWAPGEQIVVYCVHGHQVSQGCAQTLEALGLTVHYLEGGIEAWRAAGGNMAAKPQAPPSRWVTRKRPKIDRIACPWLILRFIDPQAQILFVNPDQVLATAQMEDAIPFDIVGVEMSHVGDLCSFDAFLSKYQLTQDPALVQLTNVVRGADTERFDLAPQSSGLYAVSLGLSQCFADDMTMLEHGLLVYDALYAWCQSCQGETHHWPPVTA
jgi:rhodanese-related sulfurtransferase